METLSHPCALFGLNYLIIRIISSFLILIKVICSFFTIYCLSSTIYRYHLHLFVLVHFLVSFWETASHSQSFGRMFCFIDTFKVLCHNLETPPDSFQFFFNFNNCFFKDGTMNVS